jgi:7-cyano-7-deazaguanine synthase
MRHTVVELHPNLFAPTALTGFGEVPWLPTTDVSGTEPVVVPGRNTVFLTSAASIATYDDARTVYFAAHKGDAASFPDCRPGYLAALNSLLKVAQVGVEIIAPFISRTKTELVEMGDELGVRWEDAYSCYVGKAEHCGKCGACLGRIEAFSNAGIEDTASHKYPSAR